MRIFGFVFFIAVAIGLTACGGTIDQGNVGVRTTFGKVSPEPENPGIYVAILSSVREYTGKETAINLDGMTPKARDNLSLREMDVTVYYRTAPNQIPGLQVKYANQSTYDHGLWYPAYNLVENMARTAAYEEVANQDSLTIHQHRDEVATAMKNNIQKALDQSDPGTFTITRVVMRQVITDPAIEQSILAAVKVQKEIEAKKQEIELAKAEAQRTVAEAQGTAQRNQILTQSITSQLIEYKKALAMEQCATSSGCTMIIGNGTPIINTK
mgnify:FL=1